MDPLGLRLNGATTWFFAVSDIDSFLADLRSVMRSFTGPLHSRTCRSLWLWCFIAGFHIKSLPLLPTPSQTEEWSAIGESIRLLSFYNPTPSANKHICRFSLSAAFNGLANGSGEHRTTPFNGNAQSWNGIKMSPSRAVVHNLRPSPPAST